GLLPIIVLPIMIKFLPESREVLKAQNTTQTTTVATEGCFKDVFNSQNLMRTCVISVSYFFTLMVDYIMLSWSPSWFMELGFSGKGASTAQFFFMMSATVGTIVLGMLTERWKKAYVIIVTYGGILAGLFCLNAASSLTQMYLAS